MGKAKTQAGGRAGAGRKTALLIGRFQPFHRGHERAVDYLLKHYAQVYLCVGSSQYRRTKDNPFSFVERRQLIRMVLDTHPTWAGRVKMGPLPDYPGDDEKWAKALGRRANPKEAAVGSANAWVRRCARKAGFLLDPAPLFRRNEWVGAQIRARVRAGKKWAHLVPAPLREWMGKKGARIISNSRL